MADYRSMRPTAVDPERSSTFANSSHPPRHRDSFNALVRCSAFVSVGLLILRLTRKIEVIPSLSVNVDRKSEG